MALEVVTLYTYTCDGCGMKAQGAGSAEPTGWRSVSEPSRYGPPPYRHLYRHFCSRECAERYGARAWRELWQQYPERAEAA